MSAFVCLRPSAKSLAEGIAPDSGKMIVVWLYNWGNRPEYNEPHYLTVSPILCRRYIKL